MQSPGPSLEPCSNQELGLRYEPWLPADADLLATWLASDTWPFHGNPSLTLDRARELVDEGVFFDDCLGFWMVENGERVALLRLTEVSEPTPMLDIRVRSAHRGRGLGSAGLKWITGHVFATMSDKIRIEGQTRQDNIAMRRTFLKCGYVKEAHYRRCWPAPDGTYYDSIGYGILREDWELGRTTPVDWDDEGPGRR